MCKLNFPTEQKLLLEIDLAYHFKNKRAEMAIQ